MSNTGSGGAAERSSSPNPQQPVQHSGGSGSAGGSGGSSSPQQTPPVDPPRPQMGQPGHSAFAPYTPRPEMGQPGQSAFARYTRRPEMGRPGRSAFTRYMPRPEMGGPGSAFSRPPPRPIQTPQVAISPPPPPPTQQLPRTRVAPPLPPPPPPPLQPRITDRPRYSAFQAYRPPNPPPQSSRGLSGGVAGSSRVNLDGAGFAAAEVIPIGGDIASGSGGIQIGGTGDPSARKRGMAPQPENENENVGIPWTCFVCKRQFQSFMALCGHLRHHPNRGWRGIVPPPGFNAAEEFADVPHLNVPATGHPPAGEATEAVQAGGDVAVAGSGAVADHVEEVAGNEVAAATVEVAVEGEAGGAVPPVYIVPDLNISPLEDED